MVTPIRLVMLGTGDFAVPTFVKLCDSGFNVVALITQPDRPQGRKQELIPASIKRKALAREIPVHQPERMNSVEGQSLLKGLRPDLLVTAAYGQILSAEVLSIPRLGGVNLHGSILPAYRGAAPVARAIQNGETETGVTVIRMSPKVDAGGMIAFARTVIDPEETAGQLEERLAVIGAPLVAEAIAAIATDCAVVISQDRSKVTKAPKLSKADGVIDWTQPAQRIHDLVRAMQPWPAADTHWHPSGSGRVPKRVIIHRTRPVSGSGEPGRAIDSPGNLIIGTGEGSLQILEIQAVGSKRMSASDFLRGHPVMPGDLFANVEE
jgi:methionyl-tRNA formyltransferase